MRKLIGLLRFVGLCNQICFDTLILIQSMSVSKNLKDSDWLLLIVLVRI